MQVDKNFVEKLDISCEVLKMVKLNRHFSFKSFLLSGVIIVNVCDLDVCSHFFY